MNHVVTPPFTRSKDSHCKFSSTILVRMAMMRGFESFSAILAITVRVLVS